MTGENRGSIDLTGADRPEPDAMDLERIRAAGEALRAAFTDACGKEKLLGSLTGPAECMAFTFEEQDTAPPDLILKTFLEEVGKRGVVAGLCLRADPAMTEEDVRTAAQALRDTVRRIRALLVEYNSYLSAGLPFVFEAPTGLMKERGLCIYRYPARAEVDVKPVDRAIRISFHPGPLGEVTSSGFYVPTRIRGDFTARIRYRLRQWKPGPDNACLSLFAQDEPSMVRFYAQRFTTAEAPADHRLLANLNDRQSPEVAVSGDGGAFRVMRQGTTISSWHRGEEDWVLLGEETVAEAPDMFIGSKIWSGVKCGGLEADLTDLVIEGEVPPEQTTALAERPDPRFA